MVEQVVSWALEQAPAVAVLILGFIALWRQSKKQQDMICEMLDKCWSHLIKEHENREPPK